MTTVAVIGAGISGLACAHELTRAGLSVDVYERETSAGGRMRTRTRDHLAFDLGANFMVRAYHRLGELARNVNIPLAWAGPVDHAVLRRGRPRIVHVSPGSGHFRLDSLSLFSRLRLLAFLARLRWTQPPLDFFELSSLPPEINSVDADSLIRRQAGDEVADYLVEPFHACMMFYRSTEISAAAMLALFRMMCDSRFDFGVVHSAGEMQGLADALARPLRLLCGRPVRQLSRREKGWLVEDRLYDRVVLATTAGTALALVPPDLKAHRGVLENTRYASTVNVALRLPAESLGATHCFYVPRLESDLICEFTNEAIKGPHTTWQGRSLVTIGLHEQAARALRETEDDQVMAIVRAEFLRLMPQLDPARVEPYDLQRWAEAMPKFNCEQIARVRDFQAGGQGQAGLYLCGDYLNGPWLEGACRTGQQAARQLCQDLRMVYS